MGTAEMDQICGLVDDSCVYDFHHPDPLQKRFRIQERWSSRFESVKNELDKCQLLCSNCHRKITKTDGSQRGRKRKLVPVLRWCKRCSCETEHVKFKSNKGNNRFYYRCFLCRQKAGQERYLSHSAKCVEYKGGKCEHCGLIDDPCVYDFHHTDRATKQFEIGRKYSMSFNRLKEELDKCIMLCSNCHRKTEKGLIIVRR